MLMKSETEPMSCDEVDKEHKNFCENEASRGRILYCRKCEGHGQQVILKGHAPICPYILCQCPSCEKLMNKRLKSFNKRNKEKIQLATKMAASRRAEMDHDSGRGSSSTPSSGTCSPDTVMSYCSSQQPSSSKAIHGHESRCMSLGAMTVMSYDIWKAKCASEKKEREEREREEKERKASLPATPVASEVPPRKRAHTFVTTSGTQLPRIKLNSGKEEKKGRYVTLPTIPPMSVLIADDEAPEITPTETHPAEVKEEQKPLPAPVPRKVGTNIAMQPMNPPTTTAQMPTPCSNAFPNLPFNFPCLNTQPSLPAEQILASMIPQSALPSSVLLQSSLLMNQANQQTPNFFNNFLNTDVSSLLAALSTPQPQPNLLDLLQRSMQLQQLTASLSALSPVSPSSIDTTASISNFNNPVLNQLISRQPLFSSPI